MKEMDKKDFYWSEKEKREKRNVQEDQRDTRKRISEKRYQKKDTRKKAPWSEGKAYPQLLTKDRTL